MIGLGITLWQWLYRAGGGGPSVPAGLLLADETSFLLLADEASTLLLANP